MKLMKMRTRFFLDGLGSSLSMFPNTRAYAMFSSMKLPKSDAEALADDWNSTGNDLGKAILFHINSRTESEQGKNVAASSQLSLW